MCLCVNCWVTGSHSELKGRLKNKHRQDTHTHTHREIKTCTPVRETASIELLAWWVPIDTRDSCRPKKGSEDVHGGKVKGGGEGGTETGPPLRFCWSAHSWINHDFRHFGSILEAQGQGTLLLHAGAWLFSPYQGRAYNPSVIGEGLCTTICRIISPC